MYDKFFGSFLLNKKTLTHEELIDILNHMQNTRIKIGTFAMKEGLMTGAQVEEVFQLQKKADKRFGEIAVDKGYLKEEQVEELLKNQSDESSLQLGQAAIDLNYINYEQFDEELKSFENESGLSKIQLKILEEGDTDKIIKEFIDFEGSTNSQIYYDYVSLFLKNIIRFLDQQPWIDINNNDKLNDLLSAHQYLKNDTKIFTGIGISSEFFSEIAEKFAGLSIDGDMELAESAIMELLNLHNGIFTVNMSDNGLVFSLTPPGINRKEVPDDMRRGHQIGINTAIGKINLLLSPF